MVAKMRKVHILIFVIAQVLMLEDANGFSELLTTTPGLSASATTTTKTITHTQVASTTRTPAPASPAPEDTTATTGTASPTTTTLASSNAPATIMSDVGATNSHVHRSKLKTENQKPHVAAPTRLELTAIQSKITPAAEAVTVAKNVDSFENGAVVTANSKNKSRADTLGVTGHNAGGRSEAREQIKNAKENTKWMNTFTTSSDLNSLSGLGVLKAANGPEIGETTVGVNLLRTGGSESPGKQLVTEATTMASSESRVENGLYRIKLAEIITDEFSGLLQSKASGTGVIKTAANQPRNHLNASESTMQPRIIVVPQQKQRRQQPQHKAENSQHPDTVSIVDNTNNVGHEASTAYNINYNGNSNDKQHSLKDTAGKLNITDLYPVSMEDFIPIIRDSNAKLLKERTIITHTDGEAQEHRQNSLLNDVQAVQPKEQAVFVQNMNTASSKVNRIPMPLLLSDTVAQSDSISDFTGKLLAEQDGVITEIEQKFGLSEFAATESSKIKTTGARPFSLVAAASNRPGEGKFSYSVNHKIQLPSGHEFIDRRVKKSFDFPLHRTSSDAMALPHIDFASTKFNTDTTGGGSQAAQSAKPAGESTAAGGRTATGSGTAAGHPEFSTTKFYNSKELYNEMMQHSRQKFKVKAATTTAAPVEAAEEQTAADGGANLPSAQLKTLTKSTHDFIDSSNLITSASHWNHGVSSTPTTLTTGKPAVIRVALTRTAPARLTAAEAEKAPATTLPSVPTHHANKFQNELKRTKLLLKTIMLPSGSSAAASTTEAISGSATAPNAPANGAAANTHTAVRAKSPSTPMLSTGKPGRNAAATSTALPLPLPLPAHSPPPSLQMAMTTTGTTTTMPTKPTETTPVPQHTSNSTRSTAKPIVRPRILSRLQEKVNSLECEIQSVPQDSHLWRGNETHELLLPIMTSEICPPSGVDCVPLLISWEGEAEIQSGDILIVEINDALLNPNDRNNTNSAHTTQVYQVTRSGHEHCDVTEGILLDITPLVVDGRKLVTLYDKDLTEGVNLLIVVSELWGSQCVRLKVTTKTDNCGENAECSGKGVCFSNAAMEEYECQCCNGFAGPHCEEIDACTPSPCTNNGICVDLSQGHEGNAYQCLCPYGYAGINCQYESDPCNSAECMNGGSCVGNSTHFRCDCLPGFTGPLCQHSLNECESSPCVHGICVDQEDGFRCFCQPGFAGELCNFEYNECESSPCQNDGECIDHIGTFECHCTKGYTGARCQIKVDFCTNKPCPDGHRCIDHGNDFSCECPGGRNGPECNQMPRTQCNVNPCTHGGTCWSSGDSFYCACRPGYTGTMCEDEFVVETVVSSSEFMVDDTSARNFNDKTFGSSVVLTSPIELHNAYFAAGVLAAAIFIVAIVVTICHCKVNQTYRKFSTRSSTFFPILGFGRRHKSQGKLNKHWLSGKGLGSGNSVRSSPSSAALTRHSHLPASHNGSGDAAALHAQHQQGGQLHERPFQRHLAMNLENDMYYTVDFSEHSQHSPLIQ